MPISGELGIVRLTATEQKEPQASYTITLRQPHFSIDPPPRFGDQMASKVEGVVDGARILSMR